MRGKEIKFKTVVALFSFGILCSNCKSLHEPAVTEVLMAPLVIGTKTPDYEVISATELKLSPGVKVMPVIDDNGENKGFILLRDDGTVGGYMYCHCPEPFGGNCKTVNDNPESVKCSGGCSSSEHNSFPCSIDGLIGPPVSRFRIKVVDRKEYEKSIIKKYK